MLPAPGAAADCASLDGTYRDESAAAKGEPPRHLSDLTTGPERRKLFQVEARPAPGGLAPTQPIQRPKVTHLAATVKLTHTRGGTSLRFLDAAGKPLADLGLNATGRWTCKDAHLERRSERAAGLGEVMRTERVEERLERNSAGDLVYRETLTVIKPPGGKPKVTEARFPAAR